MTRLSIIDKQGKEIQIMYSDIKHAEAMKALAESHGCTVKVLGMVK